MRKSAAATAAGRMRMTNDGCLMCAQHAFIASLINAALPCVPLRHGCQGPPSSQIVAIAPPPSCLRRRASRRPLGSGSERNCCDWVAQEKPFPLPVLRKAGMTINHDRVRCEFQDGAHDLQPNPVHTVSLARKTLPWACSEPMLASRQSAVHTAHEPENLCKPGQFSLFESGSYAT